jgi:tetratricopeptide (TPR) repeat protein
MKKNWIPPLLGVSMGILGGCQPSLAVPFNAVALSPTMLQALAYPTFLVDSQTAERYRQQGLAYRNAGSLERAIATLKIAAALDPQNLQGQVILGWTQHLAGHRTAAANTLRGVLKQEANLVAALNALGIVYLVDGQLDAAVATHQHAVDLQPDNEIAHYNLSLAYERLGQGDQAITHAQIATELEPANPHPWVALALAHVAQGHGNQAQTAYQQALRLDSRYRSRTYLEHLEKAGFSPGQIVSVATLQQQVSQ